MLTLRAPAKINLVLEVLGKRDDGYHEIRSIMQTVSLFDVLTFEDADDLSLTCSVPTMRAADNLVLKAAHMLRETVGCRKGAYIKLEKQIPWGSGLGGGSSDAAATLLGLNTLWSLRLTSEQLAKISVDIGSDVPFFIYGGTCLVEGKGERISLLPDIPPVWFVLLKPGFPGQVDKTKRLYSMLRPAHYTRGGSVNVVKEFIEKGAQIRHGLLYNAFDKVAFEAFPESDNYWKAFNTAGALEIHLAGSGPVIFTMVDSEVEARAIQKKLADYSIEAYAVSSIKRAEIGNQRSWAI